MFGKGWTLPILFIGLIMAACGTEEDDEDSDPSFWTGLGPSRGHEDITRFGVEQANRLLFSQINQMPYPEITDGVDGQFSDNPMIQGNYQTDHPTSKMYVHAGVPSSVDWHNDPSLQHFHALRGKENGVYMNNRSSCEKIRNAITVATYRGLDTLQQGDRDEGLYWIGHATHIVQDSFSQAHTERDESDGKRIKQFCTYGEEFLGVCYHKTVDPRDQVWHAGLSCVADPSNRSWDCLKGEAQWAAQATAGYLVAAGRLAFGGETDRMAILNEMYKHSGSTSNGFFDCESLPSRVIGIDQIKIEKSSSNPLSLCGSWQRGEADLNAGAGGKFLDLCYTGGETDSPITSLRVIMGKGASCPAGFEKIPNDLNEGAGGETIYLCLEHGSGNSLRELKVIAHDKSGNHCPSDWNWLPEDLNKKAGGKFVHICYR